MPLHDINEEKLNLFIDGQLDIDEMDEIRKVLLDDKDLREQVCQLKAVKELVGYAYTEVPDCSHEGDDGSRTNPLISTAIAASITLVVGVVLGWFTYEYSPAAKELATAENTFQYVANRATVDPGHRRIVLHIDSADLQVVTAALNEADHLLATYRQANIPMKLDVITNKTGINMLRPGVSPYVQRIQAMIDDGSVSFYACERSIEKAKKREGVEIVVLPGVTTDETVRKLIPERLEKGWVYIKA